MFVEKKTRMLKSKVNFALRGQHTHYFSKKESLDPDTNPTCKICGMTLSDYKIQKKYEALKHKIQEKRKKEG